MANTWIVMFVKKIKRIKAAQCSGDPVHVLSNEWAGVGARTDQGTNIGERWAVV